MLSKEEFRRKKKKMRYIRLGIVCAIGVIVLVVALLGLRAIFSTVFTAKDTPAKRAEAIKKQIEIEKNLLTKSEYTRSKEKLGKVKGIVIHYVGEAGKTAQQTKNYFESLSSSTNTEKKYDSCHYIVGIEGEIMQFIPNNEVAFASGDRNEDTIAIEYCHVDNNGELQTGTKTYENLVKLTAYLMENFELSTTDIMRHHEATSSEVNCPKYFVENETAWEKFLADVQNISDSSLGNK